MNEKPDYNRAFYTIDDIGKAEEKTRGILGHRDMLSRLEFMEERGLKELSWFHLSDCERDLIRDYCQIAPRFWPPGGQVTASCPVCDVLLYCPCQKCRAEEPAGARHYCFKTAPGKEDIMGCPNCGFSGPLREWRIR